MDCVGFDDSNSKIWKIRIRVEYENSRKNKEIAYLNKSPPKKKEKQKKRNSKTENGKRKVRTLRAVVVVVCVAVGDTDMLCGDGGDVRNVVGRRGEGGVVVAAVGAAVVWWSVLFFFWVWLCVCAVYALCVWMCEWMCVWMYYWYDCV